MMHVGVFGLRREVPRADDGKDVVPAARELQSTCKDAVKDFCTVQRSFQYGRPGEFDQSTFSKIMESFAVGDGDGAPVVQFADRLLAGDGDTPNVRDITRDFTHEVRIVFREAVVGDPVANEVGRCIVVGRHSFAKQVEYSEGVAEKYQNYQRQVIDEQGCQGHDMVSILSSCSYSPKDFNTEKDSMQYASLSWCACLMTMSDGSVDMTRHKEVRASMSEYCTTMTGPQHCLMLGCLADYHEICSWLRLAGDQDLNDPALYWRKSARTFHTWDSHEGQCLEDVITVKDDGSKTVEIKTVERQVHQRVLFCGLQLQ